MSKITKLSPDQDAELPLFRETWRQIGTRTGHDLECESMGREAVIDAYKEVGVAPPALILWAQSPVQALLLQWTLQRLLEQQAVKGPASELAIDISDSGSLGDQLWDQLWGQLWGQLWEQLGDQLRDQLWGQLWDQLGDQLRDQLGDQLGGQLWGQLRGQLGGQLWGQLRGQLWGQLGGQLWDQLRDQLRDQLWDQLGDVLNQTWHWGQCESCWSCYYRFAISIGVKVTDQQERRLAIVERLARAAFMVLSWRGVTILVQHPAVASFDDRYRLHRVDGPALEWSDGYGVYAVRGIRLTVERGQAMAGGELTAHQILGEANAEVRRVLIDAYNGSDPGRWIRDVGAELLDSDVDKHGHLRELRRVRMSGDEDYVMAHLTNTTPEPDGTHKPYWLRCHPQLRPMPVLGIRSQLGQPQEMTCHNAAAHIAGFYGRHYNPNVET